MRDNIGDTPWNVIHELKKEKMNGLLYPYGALKLNGRSVSINKSQKKRLTAFLCKN